MKVRLLLKRNVTAQYSYDDFVMETESKTVVVDLPINNRDGKNAGNWQIVGYEELKDEVEK